MPDFKAFLLEANNLRVGKYRRGLMESHWEQMEEWEGGRNGVILLQLKNTKNKFKFKRQDDK